MTLCDGGVFQELRDAVVLMERVLAESRSLQPLVKYFAIIFLRLKIFWRRFGLLSKLIDLLFIFLRWRLSAILDWWNTCGTNQKEEYLVVDIVLQNLVEIDQVVLIICEFSYLLVWLESAYSYPQNGFLEDLTP